MLMVRSMTESGDTYICSVYNKTSYTDWQKLNDGGNADTLGGLPISKFLGNNTNFTYQCINGEGSGLSVSDIREAGHYFVFNCSDTPTYYGFLDVSVFDGTGFTPSPNGIIRQIWTDWMNPMYIFVRLYKPSSETEGVWSNWQRFNDGGNADTLDGLHAADFLHSSGFAGQIEKLFCDVDTTDDLSSLFSIVPDDATLRNLNPGIYAVTTSAARNSLGIPKEGWASDSVISSKEAIQTPGGILIKFGRVFGGPNLNRSPSNVNVPGTFTDACAFFINNNGIIYHTSTVINIAPDGGAPTVSWMPWAVFLSNT